MNHEYMIHNVCLCPAGANFEFMARQAPHTRQLRPLGATDVCVWRKAGVVEFVEDTSLLTTREQVHLDWLFSLSSEFRYNICPTAESRLGTTHTAESKAAMSAAIIGNTNALGNTNRLGTTHSAETINQIRFNQPSRMSIFVYPL